MSQMTCDENGESVESKLRSESLLSQRSMVSHALYTRLIRFNRIESFDRLPFAYRVVE
jgi:hypothetical protein